MNHEPAAACHYEPSLGMPMHNFQHPQPQLSGRHPLPTLKSAQVIGRFYLMSSSGCKEKKHMMMMSEDSKYLHIQCLDDWQTRSSSPLNWKIFRSRAIQLLRVLIQQSAPFWNADIYTRDCNISPQTTYHTLLISSTPSFPWWFNKTMWYGAS